MAEATGGEATTRPAIRPLGSASEVEALRFADLSDWFNPFLPHFVRESLRSGGEVRAVVDGLEVRGLFLHDEVERTASLFARDPAVAEALFRLHDHLAIFSEFRFGAASERYDILALETDTGVADRPFGHPVRAARAEDRPALEGLMREVYGRFNDRWLGTGPAGPEKCYVATVGGRLVGAGWVCVVERHGRIHSLTVHPRYRRLGLGHDLWAARMLWAREAGARSVIAEISEHNAPSQAIARSGGMRPVGQTYQYYRP